MVPSLTAERVVKLKLLVAEVDDRASPVGKVLPKLTWKQQRKQIFVIFTVIGVFAVVVVEVKPPSRAVSSMGCSLKKVNPLDSNHT